MANNNELCKSLRSRDIVVRATDERAKLTFLHTIETSGTFQATRNIYFLAVVGHWTPTP